MDTYTIRNVPTSNPADDACGIHDRNRVEREARARAPAQHEQLDVPERRVQA